MAMVHNRIIHGDCITELAKLEAGCVDLAFADPPFNIGYEYDEYDDKRSSEDYLDWSKRWMSAVIRVLRPSGAFWLAIGDEYAAELKVIATRELGLTCRSWVVWYYTFGVHCNSKFTRSHAHLFYFIKNNGVAERRSDEATKRRRGIIKPNRAFVATKGITFNDEAIRVPSARQLVYADKRANPRGRVPDDTWILRPQDLPSRFSADSDTWYFPRVCGTFKERRGFHGCQMPEQLLGRIIKACSNEGDLVLDPFAGSGTTLAVAKKLGREYLGFEVSEDYADQSTKRLAQIKVGDALTGAEDPLSSVPDTANGKVRTATGKSVRSALESKSRPGKCVQPAELWD